MAGIPRDSHRSRRELKASTELNAREFLRRRSQRAQQIGNAIFQDEKGGNFEEEGFEVPREGTEKNT